jgi:hypothetical protein
MYAGRISSPDARTPAPPLQPELSEHFWTVPLPSLEPVTVPYTLLESTPIEVGAAENVPNVTGWHSPPMHVAPVPQGWLQALQLLASFCRFTQELPHWV